MLGGAGSLAHPLDIKESLALLGSVAAGMGRGCTLQNVLNLPYQLRDADPNLKIGNRPDRASAPSYIWRCRSGYDL
mgnify:CR=1 FL=1